MFHASSTQKVFTYVYCAKVTVFIDKLQPGTLRQRTKERNRRKEESVKKVAVEFTDGVRLKCRNIAPAYLHW